MTARQLADWSFFSKRTKVFSGPGRCVAEVDNKRRAQPKRRKRSILVFSELDAKNSEIVGSPLKKL